MKLILLTPLAAVLSCMLAPLSAQYSSPMRDVENPARFSVEAACGIVWDTNETVGKTCNAPFGPAGKVVILTSVSYFCSSETVGVRFLAIGVQSSTGNGGSIRLHPTTTQPLVSGTHVEQAATTTGLSILIPANAPQQQPTIGFGGGKVVAGGASCVAFFYGYYLP